MGYLLRGASPHLAALAKRREIVRTDLAPFAFLVARGSSHLDYRRFFSSSLPTKLLCFYLPLPPLFLSRSFSSISSPWLAETTQTARNVVSLAACSTVQRTTFFSLKVTDSQAGSRHPLSTTIAGSGRSACQPSWK